jgi:PhnB protein
MAFKPDGYTSVAPYLVVDDAQKSLDFLRAVFGCAPLRTTRRGDGSIMHSEVRIDDTVVMIGQMLGGSDSNVPTSNTPNSNIHVYVEDPDAVFQKALDAGAEVVQAMEYKGEGDRRGGVRDPNGTVWWFATEKGSG